MHKSIDCLPYSADQIDQLIVDKFDYFERLQVVDAEKIWAKVF